MNQYKVTDIAESIAALQDGPYIASRLAPHPATHNDAQLVSYDRDAPQPSTLTLQAPLDITYSLRIQTDDKSVDPFSVELTKRVNHDSFELVNLFVGKSLDETLRAAEQAIQLNLAAHHAG